LKGVILAAGKGTRMLPLSLRHPKPLIPFLDRPMIEHIISGAAGAGVEELAIVVGHRGQDIVDHLGAECAGVRLRYVWQEEARGTGDALLLAEDFVRDEPFFLSWGDIMVPPHNYGRLADLWRARTPTVALTVNWVEDPFEGAAVYLEGDRVVRIVEKPRPGTSQTPYNNAGVFIMAPTLLKALRRTPVSARGELEVPDAIQLLLQQGADVRGLPIEGYWSDVARPATVLALNTEALRYLYPEGEVVCGGEAHVARDAVLHRPCLVADGARVASGATVGPGACVLRGASVGAGARVANSLLMQGATVGERATVAWAIVEEGEAVEGGAEVTGSSTDPAIVMHERGPGE